MSRPPPGGCGVDAAPHQPPVLYAIACGSPVAGHIGGFITLAKEAGWQVWVIATPDGRKFVDVPQLAALTGHPVRSEFKNPGDPDVLPAADAIVVAPATVNTVNKWASGIADTLALALLVEAYGLGVPIVVVPYTNTAMAAHPAFRESLARLRAWGVRVLFGDDVVTLPAPRQGTERAVDFPWELALAAVGTLRPTGAGNWPSRSGHHLAPGVANPMRLATASLHVGQPTRRPRPVLPPSRLRVRPPSPAAEPAGSSRSRSLPGQEPDQVDQPVAVAPLVVVPADHPHQVAEGGGQAGVHDARGG